MARPTQPIKASLPPSVRRFAAAIAVLVAVVSLGPVLIQHGSPARLAREEAPLTYLSAAILLATSCCAAWIGLRQRGPWPWLAVGFGYLTLDELLRGHERLDWAIHHHLLRRPETPLTDHLDDLIIIGYVLIGLAILLRYRAELSRFREARPFLVWTFVFTATTIAFDLANNDIVRLFAIDPRAPQEWIEWLRLAEETAKVAAEGALLCAVFYCAHLAGLSAGGQPASSSESPPQ